MTINVEKLAIHDRPTCSVEWWRAKAPSIDRRLGLPVACALAMSIALALTGQVWHSYDFPTHVFFASHYQRDWWTLWETRWFEGFDVSSYPPLAHQLAALLGWLIGAPAAIGALLAGCLVILPVATYTLARRYFGVPTAGRAAALIVVTPSVFLASYTFGQVPTIFALVTSLFAAAALGCFLERGGASRLALTLALVAVTVAAHHATFIFFGPPLFGAVAFAEILRSAQRQQTIMRCLLVAAATIPVVILVIFPFWVWHATEYVDQVPIDHASRHDLFQDVAAQKLFFWDEHGALILALVFGLLLVRREIRQAAPWYLVAVFLFVLGLGGTTPLPRLLLGSQWDWLTYDRFSLWADVILAILFAAWVSRRLDAGSRGRWPARLAWGLTLVVLGTYGIADALRPTLINSTPAPIDPQPIMAFLQANGRDHWRYLTLGFGEQAGMLNALTDAQTVDGYYFTARRLPVLTQSGIGQIDFSLAMDPEARTIRALLADPVLHHLRWIFTRDPHYLPILVEAGWVDRATLSNGIQVWESPVDVPPVAADSAPSDWRTRALGIWWGTVPLLAFASVLPAALLAWRANRIG
jgi:hypothetical protein